MGTERKPSSARYLVLVGAVVVQLILGTVYGYSIFWQPLTADVFPEVITEVEHAGRLAAGEEFGEILIVADDDARVKRMAVQQGYLKYAFSICILSFAFVMVLAGRIQDVTGPRLPALVGAALMGVGFLVAGLASSPVVFYLAHSAFVGAVTILVLMVFHALFGHLDPQKLPVLKAVPIGIGAAAIVAGVVLGNQYVGRLGELDKLFVLWGTIGFLAGAGIGFAYVCPIAALVKWFPKQKGLVSGIAVAGFGFGAYLFKGDTIGALGYIERHGITAFFLVHALVCFVGVSIGALMLRNPPAQPAAAASAAGAAVNSDTSWQETLRRPAFHLLWLMFFSGAMAGLMVIGIIKVFAGEQLVDAAQAGGAALAEAEMSDLLLKGAAAVGWLAIFNAIGRIAWGFISDLIGRTASLVAMFLLQAVMMFLLIGMKTELAIAVAACVVGFNFGGNFALFPSATADLFGARNFGVNYGCVFTSYGIAGVVGIAAGNAAKAITGSYAAAFMVAAALCLVSAGLAIGLAVLQRRAAHAAHAA
ncbi:MAG: OFA family MFS transporter [Planctomycetes bacterium]|nr:OFA family MFS transporter [Planctomycetota bacterium]